MRGRIAAVSVAAAVVAAGAAQAQSRAGSEFRVNTFTTGSQYTPGVGRDAAGNFVVTWGDAQTFDVRAQRFDRAGNRLGTEIVVNTLPGGNARFPATAMSARGSFVVVWSEYPEPGGAGEGIRATLFDAAANRVGPELAVNTYTTGRQFEPVVAMGAGGDFVVAWVSTQDGSGYGVFAQRFDAGGARRGAEFRVNTATAGVQFQPALSLRGDGHFIVVWSDDPSDRVLARRYGADGAALGAEFAVNSVTTGYQFGPAVGFAPDGTFVVTFGSSGRDGSASAQMARRFDASGGALGAEFQVNTQTVSTQSYGWVAFDVLGNFAVQWADFAGDGDGVAVKARRYTAAGSPRGPEFLVNTYTTGHQFPNTVAPSLATDPAGNMVVAWQSPQDGAGNGIYAQRYGGLHPAALVVNRSGNGVLEPGETVDVAPSWLNVTGAALLPGGVLTRASGPAGASYTITDAAASYSIAANVASICFDCYAVSVSDPATRPLPHWDATVDETLTPDTQGQVQRWTLHVGRSFADVPPGSAFYRFVETLLHRGVTGGCTATDYCPATPTTREQMAVFTLVAREGPGYAPPACTTPVFGDVPAGSPFCRWIEELLRRGVVSGCGGGDYCPQSPVTRAQMAVFALRTLDPALDPPPCAAPNLFADVPETSPFCRWIEELANRGVVTGCGGGNYCPEDPVLRDQMGVFISATFGLTLYGP